MSSIQVDIVSPERRLKSVEADAVDLPGSDGDFSAMPGHVATATTLRPGIVKVRSGSETTEFVIAGGFAEITGESVSVMVEYAALRDEATRDMLDSVRVDAEAKVEASEGIRRADAERDLQQIDDLQRILTL